MDTNQCILVSIIVPAYNVENYVCDTIESICKNKLDNLEIIVIDDGSKDNTSTRIEECLERIKPPHYKFIKQENKGVSVARNVGIDNAEGRYLVFCDGDDLCYPNLVEELVPFLETAKELIVWGFDITQNGNRTIGQGNYGVDILQEKEVFKAFLMGKYRIRLGSFAIKKAFLEKTNIRFTVGCLLSQDVEFMYKCLSMVGDTLVINKILFTYAKRNGSVMYTYNLNRFEVPRVIKRIWTFVEENTDLESDNEVRDYLHNGFLVQHSIFSFDSCINYLTQKKQIREFLHKYYDEYSDVEQEIKRACKEMKKQPALIGKKKVLLFCYSRSLYVKISALRKKRKR